MKNESAKQAAILPFRVYAVKEIAMHYFPDYHPRSATRCLGRLIRGDQELLSRLEEHGYYKGIRKLTPAMLSILLEYLGTRAEFYQIQQSV